MNTPKVCALFLTLALTCGLSSSCGNSKKTTGEPATETSTVVWEEAKTAEEMAAEEMENDSIYMAVDQAPEYLDGGVDGLMSFIKENMHYPSVCEEKGVQGTVLVRFVIEKDGTPSNFEVVRSVDPDLDKEALRVLRLMSKWKPIVQDGKPVRVYYTIPVAFKLL